MLKTGKDKVFTCASVTLGYAKIILGFSGIGLRCQQGKQAVPEIPLPRRTFQVILGDPEVFPGQTEFRILSLSSGFLPSLMCQEKLQRDAMRKHLNQLPKPRHWLLLT